MSDAKSADHHVKRLRQSLFKFGKAFVALDDNEAQGRKTQHRPYHQSKDILPGSHLYQICRKHKGGDAHQNQPPRSPLEIGLIEQDTQAWRQLDLQQRTMEPGNGAEQLILAKIDDLVARLRCAHSQSRVQRGEDLFGLLRGAHSACNQQQSGNHKHSEKHGH